VTVLALIALWFSQLRHPLDKQKRKGIIDALHRLPTNVGMTLQSLRDACRKIALKLSTMGPNGGVVEHLFILGKGFAMPIALEGALKLKEIGYVHAEGYSGGALKHGPYALIEKGTPIIMIILDDEHAPKMKTAFEQVIAREAYTILITNEPNLLKDNNNNNNNNNHNNNYNENNNNNNTNVTVNENANNNDNNNDGNNNNNSGSEMIDVIRIPSNGVLTCLLAVLPLQLIAYELSVLRGINPDRPRNIAKTVTTD